MKNNIKVVEFINYKDFLDKHNNFMVKIYGKLETWKNYWEGLIKYILVVDRNNL
tara:strand:- start:599 stop:760 length:162 start_codon:yes stop_codon:yes gene_type:complete